MADQTRTQTTPTASTETSSADPKGHSRAPNEQPDRGKSENASSADNAPGDTFARAKENAGTGPSGAMQDKPKADAIPAAGSSSDSKRS